MDRLGRSFQNLVALLGELHAKNVNLNLHRQGLGTSAAAGKPMFWMLGVFSEFERAMIVERVKASLVRARAQGSGTEELVAFLRTIFSAPGPAMIDQDGNQVGDEEPDHSKPVH